VETQTEESWPSTPQNIVETKEKIVEMIPTKIAATMAEKDSEIQQLREEGEKLSKKQFELTTAIKKLRQKEKETDGTVKGLKSELATKNVEIERLMKNFISKESLEHTQNETIGKLNQERRSLDDLVNELRSELEDAKENTASMKASLEDASV
jgi:chromosome segregation ATPase